MSFSLSWRKNGLVWTGFPNGPFGNSRNVFRSFCVLLLLCLFFFLSVRCNLYRSPTRHICDVRRIRCLSVLRRLFERCFFHIEKRVGRQQVYTSYVYTPRYEGVDHFDEVGREKSVCLSQVDIYTFESGFGRANVFLRPLRPSFAKLPSLGLRVFSSGISKSGVSR